MNEHFNSWAVLWLLWALFDSFEDTTGAPQILLELLVLCFALVHRVDPSFFLPSFHPPYFTTIGRVNMTPARAAIVNSIFLVPSSTEHRVKMYHDRSSALAQELRHLIRDDGRSMPSLTTLDSTFSIVHSGIALRVRQIR